MFSNLKWAVWALPPITEPYCSRLPPPREVSSKPKSPIMIKIQAVDWRAIWAGWAGESLARLVENIACTSKHISISCTLSVFISPSFQLLQHSVLTNLTLCCTTLACRYFSSGRVVYFPSAPYHPFALGDGDCPCHRTVQRSIAPAPPNSRSTLCMKTTTFSTAAPRALAFSSSPSLHPYIRHILVGPCS